MQCMVGNASQVLGFTWQGLRIVATLSCKYRIMPTFPLHSQSIPLLRTLRHRSMRLSDRAWRLEQSHSSLQMLGWVQISDCYLKGEFRNLIAHRGLSPPSLLHLHHRSITTPQIIFTNTNSISWQRGEGAGGGLCFVFLYYITQLQLNFNLAHRSCTAWV